VVLPEGLVAEVDALVGRRQRSRFLAEAVREKLEHIRLVRAAERAAGSLQDVETPGWETSESTTEWVRSLRQEWDQRHTGEEERQ
jgi:metal-responsive CopG/Arc/MetJ family transcriptional regulator